ncbi:MAG: hypothetical protein AAGJ40_07820 [Planctomycetota bacterium]
MSHFGWRILTFAFVIGIVALTCLPTHLLAQTTADTATVPGDETTAPSDNEAKTGREERLAQFLTGATFTGNFTLDGKEDRAPKPESYVIDACRYVPETGKYEMTVQIRYGKTDGVFPILLDVAWAGATPVITLDSVWIPGLGTFSSRVLIRNGRYAGTWQHDAKGGHLFGKITPK